MIVIISELYYPEDTSTGYIITKIAEGLAEKFPVRVLTGLPDYSEKKNARRIETKNNVCIERIAAPYFNKNKIGARIIRAFLLSLGLAWKALRVVNKEDTVLVVTNPAPMLILVTVICRFIGASFIILVHDVFPDNLDASQLLKKESPAYRVFYKIFNSIFNAADHIIVIGRDMKEMVRKKLNNIHPDISVITNWADTSDIFPEDRSSNQLIQKYNLEKHFIVEFAGNFGRVQGIEYIVTAAEILKNENIHFMFIGSGAKKELIQREINARGLSNITMIDALPRSEQQVFLNACDIGLVSLAPGMAGLGVPSKTYNILAAGKPVIAVVDSLSEIGLLVKEEEIGWVVTPGDPAALATAILEAKKHPGLADMGRAARAVAENKYSLSNVVNKYRELFASYV